MKPLQTVIELDSFIRSAKAIMSDEERTALVDYLAANPEAGVHLGSGLRKARVARQGGGKRGGFRTIYVFAGEQVPLIAIEVFAKNEKANLSRREQNELVVLAKQLVANYGESHG